MRLGSYARRVHCAAGDRLVNVEIAIADLDVEAARWVRAGPCFEIDGSPLAAKVRKWYEVPQVTLLALRKTIHHDHIYLPRRDVLCLFSRKYSCGLFLQTSKKVKVLQ
jgi:hypothetical protein